MVVLLTLKKCTWFFDVNFIFIPFSLPKSHIMNSCRLFDKRWKSYLHKLFHLYHQGTIIWRASSNPDFIQNYFLLKRMFDFFDNRNKCRKPGFLRGKIYTSCISMVLLDHFANKSNTFRHSLSLSLSPISSHFLLGSPLPPIPDPRIAQLMVPCLITSLVYKCH